VGDQPDFLPLRRLIPNLMTLGALCAGLTAIRVAFAGETALALGLVLLAALIDGFDGRVAHYLDGETAMGAELDILADFLNFGVAPAFILYWAALDGDGQLGWIAVILYALACVLRLARFNIAAGLPQTGPKTHYTGVPSPAGAFLALVPLYLMLGWPGLAFPDPLLALWLVMVGALMVSTLPTPALPALRIRRDRVQRFLLAVAGVGACLVLAHWLTLAALALAYLAFVLTGWVRIAHDRLSQGKP
jgi:CDP-diacylglycerol---serine O-phosphatidyltransferase